MYFPKEEPPELGLAIHEQFGCFEPAPLAAKFQRFAAADYAALAAFRAHGFHDEKLAARAAKRSATARKLMGIEP